MVFIASKVFVLDNIKVGLIEEVSEVCTREPLVRELNPVSRNVTLSGKEYLVTLSPVLINWKVRKLNGRN